MKITTLKVLQNFKNKIVNLLANKVAKLTGDITTSVTSNNTSQIDLKALRRGCIVGCDASSITNHWYKFAAVDINWGNTDCFISFKVTRMFGDTLNNVGILTAHIRTDTTGKVGLRYLKWEYAGIAVNINHFVMAYNNTSPAIVELWVHIPVVYAMYHFDVIAEGNRQYRGPVWSLNSDITSAGGKANITEGYTQQASELMVIQNPTSG